MGKKIPDTLRYWSDGIVIRLPNVPDICSARYGFLMKALDFFKELSETHGSQRVDGPETYWESKFAPEEINVVHRWFSWHGQYIRVENMIDLFMVSVET